LVLEEEEEGEIKLLVRELIGFQVSAILKEYYAVDSLAYSLVFDKYWGWFFMTYSEMDFFHGHNYSFRGMAEASFAYTEWCIGQISYHAPVPLAITGHYNQQEVVVTPERVNSA
jgi:hypothetical protein